MLQFPNTINFGQVQILLGPTNIKLQIHEGIVIDQKNVPETMLDHC